MKEKVSPNPFQKKAASWAGGGFHLGGGFHFQTRLDRGGAGVEDLVEFILRKISHEREQEWKSRACLWWGRGL
ncbi:MAG: hypothetical protein KKA60_04065, partial [Proteobacteria bacterium]|nr:hypothetical protein [Pseudomonadota bacterium]